MLIVFSDDGVKRVFGELLAANKARAGECDASGDRGGLGGPNCRPSEISPDGLLSWPQMVRQVRCCSISDLPWSLWMDDSGKLNHSGDNKYVYQQTTRNPRMGIAAMRTHASKASMGMPDKQKMQRRTWMDR